MFITAWWLNHMLTLNHWLASRYEPADESGLVRSCGGGAAGKRRLSDAHGEPKGHCFTGKWLREIGENHIKSPYTSKGEPWETSRWLPWGRLKPQGIPKVMDGLLV